MEELLSVALDARRKELQRATQNRQQPSGAADGSDSDDLRGRKMAPTLLQPKEQAKGASDTSNGPEEAPRKRKKISRACNNCQVAHLTCSTSRPCVRCVKRGLGDSCQDGARKKAKYLLDVEDELVNAGKAHPTNFLPSSANDSSVALSNDGDETDTKVPPESSYTAPQAQLHRDPVFAQDDSLPLDTPTIVTHGVQNSSDNSANALSRAIEALTSNSAGSDNQVYVNGNGNNNFLTPFASLNDFDLNNDFGSSSANLEYAVLSSMLQNSGYGNYSPNAFPNSLPALSMDNLSDGQSFGISDFPALQTGYSDSMSQVSPSGGNGSQIQQQQTFNNSHGQHGRSHANSTSSNFNYGPNVMNGSSFLSPGDRRTSDGPTTNFLSSDVASFFGAVDSLSQSPVQGDHQYNQSHSSMSHYESTPTFGTHQQTPQSDLSTPQSQQQPLPAVGQESHAQSGSGSGYSPLSNPNGGSLTSTQSFSSALDWNNTKPSAGLAAPAGPSRTLPQRQVSFPAMLNPRQQQQLKQVQRAQQQQQQQRQQQLQQAQQGGSKPVRSSSRPLVSSTGVMRPEDVYKRINKPYNYLEAYHALIRHLQTNFDSKSDVRRIIRALSVYRPSLIALQMPLSVDDEIFVERSFQRTLIELEKLISFSGTPTVVWRRTGEIMLVGTEFSMLSEWKRDQLLFKDRDLDGIEEVGPDGQRKPARPKRRYIFEVFDQKSCVEYYESFAAHAFESSTSTIMQTCNIVTPKGRKVPCTFAYTIKRDIFGLPNRVIGQFLPILTNDI